MQSPYANERYRTNRALAEIALGDINAAQLDAPGMDETMLRRTLARYQPRQEPIQVAARGQHPDGCDAARARASIRRPRRWKKR